ncbi:hypothetical protein MTR67_034507 [Solanum verrucosum]|uniref:Uncharacterized protein n=1 Tax=Solanum verrucosum TaxID=315347 RepID=A0AAF0U884_SOLVR|nr:hypothetical protein MTR67_034507 [Solanum verrucosum]
MMVNFPILGLVDMDFLNYRKGFSVKVQPLLRPLSSTGIGRLTINLKEATEVGLADMFSDVPKCSSSRLFGLPFHQLLCNFWLATLVSLKYPSDHQVGVVHGLACWHFRLAKGLLGESPSSFGEYLLCFASVFSLFLA